MKQINFQVDQYSQSSFQVCYILQTLTSELGIFLTIITILLFDLNVKDNFLSNLASKLSEHDFTVVHEMICNFRISPATLILQGLR